MPLDRHPLTLGLALLLLCPCLAMAESVALVALTVTLLAPHHVLLWGATGIPADR